MSASEPLPWTPVKIGWISGVSRPGTRALIPEQLDFVESLPGDPMWKLRTNFPYGGSSKEPKAESRRVPLAMAAAVNLTHFLLSSQPIRRPSRRRAWRDLRASCELLLLVTNSCGSQLVQALEGGAQPGSTLRTLSLGPVDWGADRLEERVTLRGSLDHVRVPGSKSTDITLGGLGHMDYARSAEVRVFAGEWVQRQLQRSGHGHGLGSI